MTESGKILARPPSAFEEIDKLHALIDMVPGAMLIIDERGFIKSFSKGAERMFGYGEEQVVGEDVSILMPSPDREAHNGYIKHYLETGEKRMIGTRRVTTARRRDGSTFPVELSVGELPLAGERHFTGYVRDLSESQQKDQTLQTLQEDLAHVSRISSMGGLANSIAHELNQPLTAITNYSAAGVDLLDDLSPEAIEDIRHSLSECRKEAMRAGEIIRKLRDFISRGDTVLEIASIRDLVNSATALALVNGDGRDLDFSMDLDPACKNVLVVPIQIQQVLVNLIRNALEAMQGMPGKRLRLASSCEPDSMVRIAVSDSGPGLDPHVASRLFHPFVSTKTSGMGLGLSICHTIVNAHGGKIRAGPSDLGGTEFSFTLKSAQIGAGDD